MKQRDDTFSKYILMGDKKGDAPKLFETFSLGAVTNRDAWCYNASKAAVTVNMIRMIDFYNQEVVRFHQAHAGLDKKSRESRVDDFINTEPTNISWSRALKQELAKDRKFSFEPRCLTRSLYRPFYKQWLYFHRRLNEMVLQMPRIFPNATNANRAIMIKGNWRGDGQFAVMIDSVVCLQPDGGAQCFPLYVYDKAAETADDDLFSSAAPTSAAQYTTFPISMSLPLRDDAFKGGRVVAVFENLLPDSEQLRQRVAEICKCQ